MLRYLLVIFGLLWLSSPALLAQDAATDVKRSPVAPDINDRFLDPELNPKEWLNRFEIESREVFAARKEVVEALQLSPGMRIADIGSGTGLFIGLFSAAVGDEGKVFAVDISPRFVDFLKRRVKAESLDNVNVILSKATSPELKPLSVDRVFICDTYHHFEFHQAMLEDLHEALVPGGQLILVDFERIPGKSREWILGHVRAGKKGFRSEVEKAGFEFVEEVKIDGFEENYVLRFRKP